jgi:hypothetical protein
MTEPVRDRPCENQGFRMREIEVGIRVDKHEGLWFFGTDEVNDLLRRGGRVVAIEPGGAIMRKLGEDAENVRLTLSGFSLKVKIEEA